MAIAYAYTRTEVQAPVQIHPVHCSTFRLPGQFALADSNTGSWLSRCWPQITHDDG